MSEHERHALSAMVSAAVPAVAVMLPVVVAVGLWVWAKRRNRGDE